MNSKFHTDLKAELRLAGASSSEVNGLIAIAGNLKLLENTHRSVAKNPKSKRLVFKFVGLSSLGLAVLAALVIFSQTVLPGSWLYPVQKLSDNTAVFLSPNYRGTIMMKRANEVKRLVADNANSNIVLATLADYQKEASVYRSYSANYAAFEYCKTNLKQAAVAAPSSEREAINKTLLSLANA